MTDMAQTASPAPVPGWRLTLGIALLALSLLGPLIAIPLLSMLGFSAAWRELERFKLDLGARADPGLERDRVGPVADVAIRIRDEHVDRVSGPETPHHDELLPEPAQE